jgi:hypothetical protein
MALVSGRYASPADPGVPAVGKIWFTLQPAAVDAGGVQRTQGPVVVALDDQGSFSVDLVPDSELVGVNGVATWRVDERIVGLARSWWLAIVDDQPVDLPTAYPGDELAPYAVLVPHPGPPGPPGPAGPSGALPTATASDSGSVLAVDAQGSPTWDKALPDLVALNKRFTTSMRADVDAKLNGRDIMGMDPQWYDPNTAYAEGDIVQFNMTYFVAKNDAAAGENPSTHPGKWLVLDLEATAIKAAHTQKQVQDIKAAAAGAADFAAFKAAVAAI